MPKQRYFRLQEITFDTFNLDAPVEIEKGALLLDNETKSVILQLKNTILIDDFKQISSVKISVVGFDDAGDEIEGFNPFYYTFRDINLLGKKSFGDKTAILLDKRIRRIKVDIDRVVFVSGKIWENDKREIPIPKQRDLNTLGAELQKQWKREKETFTAKQVESLQYFPQQEDDYWICTCGRPNNNDAVHCCRCGINQEVQFSIINETILEKNIDAYKEKIRIQKEEYLALKKKRKKQISLTLGIITGIMVIGLLFNFVGLPEFKYNQANKFLANKEFDYALYIFHSLGDYRNSEEMVKEANYQKASELLNDKNYEEAVMIFSYIEDYKDVKDLNSDAYYSLGVEFEQNEMWEEAILAFSHVDDNTLANIAGLIENATTNLELQNKETDYYKAKGLALEEKYQEAYKILKDLDYLDSASLAREYERKAYEWVIEGGMLKDEFSENEQIQVKIKLLGGRDGDKVDLDIAFSTRNKTRMHTIYNMSRNQTEIVSFSLGMSHPLNRGIAYITVQNGGSNEVLARYEFKITRP